MKLSSLAQPCQSDYLVELLAVDASRLGQEFGRIVDSTECAPGSVHALRHQEAGNDDPESIHEDKVSPIVRGLRTRVGDVEDVVVEHGGCIVENIAVELA
jgi:hypothetical protein